MTQSVREREQAIARKIEPLIVGHLTEVLSASGGRIDAYGGIELVRSLRDQIASTLSPDLFKAVEALKECGANFTICTNTSDAKEDHDRMLREFARRQQIAASSYESLTRKG